MRLHARAASPEASGEYGSHTVRPGRAVGSQGMMGPRACAQAAANQARTQAKAAREAARGPPQEGHGGASKGTSPL